MWNRESPYRLYAKRPLEKIQPAYGSREPLRIVDPIGAKEDDLMVYGNMEVGYYRRYRGWALVQWHMRRIRRRWRKLKD